MKIKPKEIKTCNNCGKEFFPKNSTREIYCSDKCRRQATYQRQRDRRQRATCMICGVDFEYTGMSRRKRCDECTEADIRKPYNVHKKRKKPANEKRSSAAEKAARLARLPEGANPKDAWMEDVGAIQITPRITRTGAKAAIKINPAKLRPPFWSRRAPGAGRRRMNGEHRGSRKLRRNTGTTARI